MKMKYQQAKSMNKDVYLENINFPVLAAIKYDGCRVFVFKDDGIVFFKTTGGLSFDLPNIKKIVENIDEDDFVLECEFLYNHDGKMGGRNNSNKIKTFTTEFKKGIVSDDSLVTLRVFNSLDVECFYDGEGGSNAGNFHETKFLVNEFSCKQLLGVDIVEFDNKDNLQKFYDSTINSGYEGLMLYSPSSYWTTGRNFSWIKWKPIKTVNAACVRHSKQDGQINKTITCEDENGIMINVGGSIPDIDLLNKKIELKYEQFVNGVYIQPVFSGVRGDK